ncbi:hypothetical protein [Fibrobacter sp. UWB16]|nr:hypothetical protein [Fibrobacter sp. UWB16]
MLKIRILYVIVGKGDIFAVHLCDENGWQIGENALVANVSFFIEYL